MPVELRSLFVIMDARMTNMEESLRQITLALTNAGLIPNERPIEQNNHNPIPRNHEDRTIRINLDEFDGLTHDPEVYIEWESSL